MPCEPSYNLHEMQEESTIYRHLRGDYTKNYTKYTKENIRQYLRINKRFCGSVILYCIAATARFLTLVQGNERRLECLLFL